MTFTSAAQSTEMVHVKHSVFGGKCFWKPAHIKLKLSAWLDGKKERIITFTFDTCCQQQQLLTLPTELQFVGFLLNWPFLRQYDIYVLHSVMWWGAFLSVDSSSPTDGEVFTFEKTGRILQLILMISFAGLLCYSD